jgi:hypothetical protein
LLADADSTVPAGSELYGIFKTASLSLGADSTATDRGQRLEDIGAALENLSKELKRASANRTDSIVGQILVLGYIAAHLDDESLAQSALRRSGADDAPPYSMRHKLRNILMAEMDRISGQPAAAIENLKRLLDDSEPFLAHVALQNAYSSAGMSSLALDEARWLTDHRGRAYAEYYPGNLLTVFNVEQSNLSLLYGAKFALTMHDYASARAMLGEFRKAWPDAQGHPAYSRQINKVQEGLPEPGAP